MLTTTRDGVSRRIRVGVDSTARLNALFSAHEAAVEITLSNGGVTAFNSFDQTIVLTVQTIKNKASELGITQRLSNGCKSVGGHLDLVEVGVRGEIALLHLTKFVAELHSPS
jgi:hypothetical protein